MSQDDTTPENPNENLETPETLRQEPAAPEEEPGEPGETTQGIEIDLEQVARDFEKAGIKKEEAEGFIARRVQDVMRNRALKALEKTEEAGTKYAKLRALWELLSEEGRRKYIEDVIGFWNMVKKGLTPTPVILASSLFKEAKVRLAPQSWLDLEDFDQNEVKTLLALGVLDCPPDLQGKIDHQMSSTLHKMGWAMKVLMIVFPEAIPELRSAGQGVSWIEKGVGFFEAQLPSVRSEVQKRRQEVNGEAEREHEQVAKDVTPQVDLDEAA